MNKKLIFALALITAVASAGEKWPSKERQVKNIEDWLPYFEEASKKHDVPLDVLVAVASRETGVRNIRGDYRNGQYNGYGVMQIDINDSPEWVKQGRWKNNPREAIMKGAEILAKKRDEIKKYEGKKCTVISSKNGKKYHFTGAKIKNTEDLWKVAAASFNAGMWGYQGYSVYGNQDRHTTGKDYSVEIVASSGYFSRKLPGKIASTFGGNSSGPLVAGDPNSSAPNPTPTSNPTVPPNQPPAPSGSPPAEQPPPQSGPREERPRGDGLVGERGPRERSGPSNGGAGGGNSDGRASAGGGGNASSGDKPNSGGGEASLEIRDKDGKVTHRETWTPENNVITGEKPKAEKPTSEKPASEPPKSGPEIRAPAGEKEKPSSERGRDGGDKGGSDRGSERGGSEHRGVDRPTAGDRRGRD